MAVVGAVAASLVARGTTALPVILVASLGVSLLLGIGNGLLVGYVKVPPIVATLVVMVAGRGLAQLINDGNTVSFHTTPRSSSSDGERFSPFPSRSRFSPCVRRDGTRPQKNAAGLFIEAVGDNETASQNAGVNPRRVKLLVYAVCGLCAGLAGIIGVSDLMTSDAGAGLNLELDAILACVIGGTSLQGGRFLSLAQSSARCSSKR